MMIKEVNEEDKNEGKTQSTKKEKNRGNRLARLLKSRVEPSSIHKFGRLVEQGNPVTLTLQDVPCKIFRLYKATVSEGYRYRNEKSQLFCKVRDHPEIMLCSFRLDVTMCSLDIEFQGSDDLVISVKGRRGIYIYGYYFKEPLPPKPIHIPNRGQAVSRKEKPLLPSVQLTRDHQIRVNKSKEGECLKSKEGDMLEVPLLETSELQLPIADISKEAESDGPIFRNTQVALLEKLDPREHGVGKEIVKEESKADQAFQSQDAGMIGCAEQGEISQGGHSVSLKSVYQNLDFEVLEEESVVNRVMPSGLVNDNSRCLEPLRTEKGDSVSISNDGQGGEMVKLNLHEREKIVDVESSNLLVEEHGSQSMDFNIMDEQKLTTKKRRRRIKTSSGKRSTETKPSNEFCQPENVGHGDAVTSVLLGGVECHEDMVIDSNNERDDPLEQNCVMTNDASDFLNDQKLKPKKKKRRDGAEFICVYYIKVNNQSYALSRGLDEELDPNNYDKHFVDAANQPCESVGPLHSADRDDSEDRNCMRTNVVPQLSDEQKLEPKKKGNKPRRVSGR